MTESQSPNQSKSTLRAKMKAVRAAIPRQVASVAANRLVASLAAIPDFARSHVISGFLAFGDEIDTAPLLANLHAARHRLCLPVMQGKADLLLFRA